ncbi:MAG: recombinase family protein [Planctomycetaceae bacterium]|nr:recombinase family protein [Planctomycetaceae bacterium]
MNLELGTHQKVTASHLRREAYLYVRQSTLRQVFENTESTERQYALRERAVALGWPIEQITVIDHDLGLSGASAADRAGFQRLVTEVGLGHAGIVLGLEVSRLARNCADWHRLLEICALTDTLILDEDGLYDPSHFNDRLLLGLKGTMSEAELHVLRARLQGGLRNKARRGELQFLLPVGLVYDLQGRVVLDPDQQVQQTLHTFFQTYERTASALAVVKFFRREKLLFPRHVRGGPRKGELICGPLIHSRALQMLHNPRYAGAFAFGRSSNRKRGDGHVEHRQLPQDQWHTLLLSTHPGYITWEQYQVHQQQLRDAAQSYGDDRRHGPAGEGPALLQGLVLCGVCGRRMSLRYHRRPGGLVPQYICQRESTQHGEEVCQSIHGQALDAAIGRLLLERMTPVTLNVAFAVQQELQARFEEVDRLRQQQVERARYEADLARQRYMQVDPGNRLVADALEADWNEKLRTLTAAQDEAEQRRATDHQLLDERCRAQVLALATDFPKLWNSPQTSARDRKRMVRLLIEDVTLTQTEMVLAQVRFKGGATHPLSLARPPSAWKIRQTAPEVVAEIDRLLTDHVDSEIAAQLNERGWTSGEGRPFSNRIVANIRRDYRLKPRFDRLRARGLLTIQELAAQLGVSRQTICLWCRQGLLQGHAYNDKHECLFEPPTADSPTKQQGHKLADRRRFPKVPSHRRKEVQDEA